MAYAASSLPWLRSDPQSFRVQGLRMCMEVMSYKETRRKHLGTISLSHARLQVFHCIVMQNDKMQEQRANVNLCSSLTVVKFVFSPRSARQLCGTAGTADARKNSVVIVSTSNMKHSKKYHGRSCQQLESLDVQPPMAIRDTERVSMIVPPDAHAAGGLLTTTR